MSIFRFFNGRAAGPAQLEGQNVAQPPSVARRGYEAFRASMADALAGIRQGRAAYAAECATQQATQSMAMLTQRPTFHPGANLNVDRNGGRLGGQGSPVPHGAGPERVAAFMADRTGGTLGFRRPAQTGRVVPTVPPTRIPKTID